MLIHTATSYELSAGTWVQGPSLGDQLAVGWPTTADDNTGDYYHIVKRDLAEEPFLTIVS